jgi:hypothetical protein
MSKKKKNKKHEKYYKVDTKPVNTLIKAKSSIGISVNDPTIPNLTRAGKPGVQLDALKQTEILYLYPNPSENKPLIWSKERKEK